MSNDLFEPHVPAEKTVKEFTLRALCVGLVFGLFFAVANGYLALKIGATISASIPASIMSMALLRIFFKGPTALEHNIIQTTATVGEGLAAGVIFTVPALILLKAPIPIFKIFLLASLGGILGILFMIPMRRFVIVEEHKKLPFPEGTACAELIKAGEKKHSTAIFAMWGFLVAGVYKILCNGFFVWKETVSWTFDVLKKGTIALDTTPAILGVGFIIGPRIAGLMFAGGVISWWVMIPLIVEFGLGTGSIYPSNLPIAQMDVNQIWDEYVRYIGAGCLATGGIYSLFSIFPLLYKTVHTSFKELFSGFLKRKHLIRTDRDISMAWLVLGSISILLLLWLLPIFGMNFLTILLLIVLGFIFVAVTSITVGLVGSSSNPASGMIITTLLITCTLFVFLGWTERVYLISAVTMGAVSSCAICMAGTTSQDLKTGYLLGATPLYQQVAEILGVFLPSLALGYVVYSLNETYHIGSSLMPAPQATLLSLVADGVIQGNLPFSLIGVGIFLGISMILLRIPVLPFALGVYLPLSLSAATMVGALAKVWVDRLPNPSAKEKGILFCSGLIGGDACLGILLAFATLAGFLPPDKKSLLPPFATPLFFAFLACLVVLFCREKKER